ncbi:hypothetical protein ACWEXK_12450 [Staphylococcus xylosus]|uniref:hypothetical protein n=1 Tax=Staphylococcus xylosus TaxID=1288 RepID=UPI000D1EC7F0|nr:hypothetical protein [Staphylococcus xylosus]PTI16295.1 hypothetical protein BU115_13190 [Staphylococcus xylosus]
MAMTQRQAIEILYQLDACFDMNFANDKVKYDLWCKKLIDKGDYELTLAKANQYIEENHFKPVIADILVKAKKHLQTDVVDEQTKLHRWKMENDPEYKREREIALQKMKETMDKFNLGENDNE